MDLKKRVVGGLVGLVLGAQLLSMSGCASTKTRMFGGTKTLSYAQIEKKGLYKIDIEKLNKNKNDYKKKYVRVEGVILSSCFPEEASKDKYMCTPILSVDGLSDRNNDGKVNKDESMKLLPMYISGGNPGVLKLLYEFAQAKDRIGIIGKFSFGRHVLYDNEWGIEITHLVYHDDVLGRERYLDLNYADEEKVKGWLSDFNKALGKGMEKGFKAAF